ncbi:uncharacterized protein BDZ99DRAFT_577181 [Mytilinidion resinicola]|uniref:Uncharacterized protein n=1 Tax=Mytilinidion resinicola TaxID=574789 RepID=A0A6A6Y0A6_9PEZI|nr:uncharacterized protein BDZ99DRAFT_577181 [Mytilinidion resinicola]KAF2801953.1 hypothetical protein BDZ99DRAFT_577181 [Mytilinidion resinicola]
MSDEISRDAMDAIFQSLADESSDDERTDTSDSSQEESSSETSSSSPEPFLINDDDVFPWDPLPIPIVSITPPGADLSEDESLGQLIDTFVASELDEDDEVLDTQELDQFEPPEEHEASRPTQSQASPEPAAHVSRTCTDGSPQTHEAVPPPLPSPPPSPTTNPSLTPLPTSTRLTLSRPTFTPPPFPFPYYPPNTHIHLTTTPLIAPRAHRFVATLRALLTCATLLLRTHNPPLDPSI